MPSCDVLVISDFRLESVSHRLAAEVEIQKKLGLKTLLLQQDVRPLDELIPWNAAITSLLEAGQVEVAILGESIQAGVVVIRDPRVAENLDARTLDVSTDRVVVVASDSVFGARGPEQFDVMAANAGVEKAFGLAPMWAPTSSSMREQLLLYEELSLVDEDWEEPGAGPVASQVASMKGWQRPVVGWHSQGCTDEHRDALGELQDADPKAPHFDVQVLESSGREVETASPPILRDVSIAPFGSVDAAEFFEELHFWVCFQEQIETDGHRGLVFEALKRGLVVILPPHFSTVFKDAAVYGTPSDVRGIVADYQTGERDYQTQSERARRFAKTRETDLHAKRIIGLLSGEQGRRSAPLVEVGNGGSGGSSVHVPTEASYAYWEPMTNLFGVPRSDSSGKQRPLVLAITSNGHGLGHLTRMLSVARAGRSDYDTFFFSMSEGVKLVERLGFRYEYMPSSTRLGARAGEWHGYLESRLKALLGQLRPQAVILDGTTAYRGVMNALDSFPEVRRVWMRRGLWHVGTPSVGLELANRFDLVVEPLDYAASVDTGPTSERADKVLVPPITLLNPSEVLGRDEAREELALEPDAKLALVSLRGGTGKEGTLQDLAVEAIESKRGWEAIVGRAPLSTTRKPRARSISYFPLARYIQAFDFAISAPGYNFFTEAMQLGIPTIWVPREDGQADNQHARADWAAAAGVGFSVRASKPHDLVSTIDRLQDAEVRRNTVGSLETHRRANGARAVAAMLLALSSEEKVR